MNAPSTPRCIAQNGPILIVGTPERCVSVDVDRGVVYPVTSLAVIERFGFLEPPSADRARQSRAVAMARPVLADTP